MKQITHFNKGVQYYRIKPDEPKFKVGDWVRVSDNCVPTYICQYNDKLHDIYKNDMKSIISWRPNIGEWCWFWNDKNHPVVRMFDGMVGKPYIYGASINNIFTDQSYENCIPFIGELPENLK